MSMRTIVSLSCMQVLPDLAADLEQLQHKPNGAVLPLTHPGVELDALPGGATANNAVTRRGGVHNHGWLCSPALVS